MWRAIEEREYHLVYLRIRGRKKSGGGICFNYSVRGYLLAWIGGGGKNMREFKHYDG